MTKQEKLDAIYEAMADKALNDGCTVRMVGDLVFIEEDETTMITKMNDGDKIIGHPVRIGDVLKYIDTHHCFIDNGEGHKSRDMEELDSMLRTVFYCFVGKQDRPIDEQDESCIDYVFSLIQK